MSDPQERQKLWLAEKLRKRGEQSKLAKVLGLDDTKVSRMKKLKGDGESRAIEPHELPVIARFFNELPPGYEEMTSWLDDQPEVPRPTPNASFPPIYRKFSGDSYIPVRGQSAGGANGKFVLNGAEVGRVFTPPELEGVEGAYAVRVFGTSMHPRFKPGETVWLNPYLPVRQGDDCVVQLSTDEPEGRESYIKEFVSRSNGALRLFQHNPDVGETKEITFDNSKVLAIHKVVFQAML